MEVLEKPEIENVVLEELECCNSEEDLLTEEEFKRCIEEAERNGEISHIKAERFLMAFRGRREA
jgi:hypothetical protein